MMMVCINCKKASMEYSKVNEMYICLNCEKTTQKPIILSKDEYDEYKKKYNGIEI